MTVTISRILVTGDTVYIMARDSAASWGTCSIQAAFVSDFLENYADSPLALKDKVGHHLVAL